MWDYRARIDQVHDGDTVAVTLDLGFGLAKSLRLRLYDTWAPELTQPGGPETREFAAEWADWNNPDDAEWPFVVTTQRVQAGTHEVTTLGRYVGTLASDDGDTLNDAVRDYVATQGYVKGIGAP